jgi:FkbM family methyltransferase
MEKIIHFTVPKTITSVQAQTIEHARTLHPAWEIKLWQDPVQADGYLLEKYWPNVNSGAQLADLLRLDLVYRWGGIYVDSDLLLLKPLDDLAKHFDFFAASEDGYNFTNALIGATKGHPAVRALINELLSNEPDWSLPPNRTTGPILFAHVLKWNRDVSVLPRETFYSYNWNEPHFKKNHRHSYGEHLWASSWKRQHGTPIDTATGSFDWRSNAKRLVKPAITAAFRFWDRIKSLDPLPEAEPIKHYNASGELVVQTIHGFNIVVDGNDVAVTPDLIFSGWRELPEENFVKRVLRGGDWMLDVGSHIGLFCILAAQCVGSFGRVFAYEPSSKSRKLLYKSAVMNCVHDRLVVRPVAVRESAGNVRLAFTPDGLGDTQVGQEESTNSTYDETIKSVGRNNLTAFDVPSVTLDQEFPVDLPIKLLRIDVEGEEGSVLTGAHRLLGHRCIDYILVRVLRDVAGSRRSALLAQLKWLTELDYVSCTLATDGSLIEHKSVTLALDRLEGRNIVMMARDQYKNAGSV